MSHNIDWATNNEQLSFHYVNPKVTTNNLIARRWGGILNWAGSYFLSGDIAYQETLVTIVGWKIVGGFQFHDSVTAVGPAYESGAVGDYISLKWHSTATTQNTWRQLSITCFVLPSHG